MTFYWHSRREQLVRLVVAVGLMAGYWFGG
jgi:hypothetical protein